MNALEVRGLHTYYGKSHILQGVDLAVGQGEIVTLLGRNGAGKTTTMRSIVGLTPAKEGVVRVFDNVTTDRTILLCVNRSAFVYGDRRAIKLARQDMPVVDSSILVVTRRLVFASYFPADKTCAVLRNIQN